MSIATITERNENVFKDVPLSKASDTQILIGFGIVFLLALLFYL